VSLLSFLLHLLSFFILDRQGLLGEKLNLGRVLAQKGGELVRQVYQIVRVNITSLVVLTVPVNVVTTKVLLIEENYDTVIGMTHYCASNAKRHILSFRRVDIDNSVTNLIVIGAFS